MRPWFTRGWCFRPEQHAQHGFARLGAFVDGVYAIVATLLAIEIRLPEDVPAGELGPALASLGEQYAAYAFGFLQMIAGWLQTRRLDAWLRGVDHYLTLLVLAGLGIYALTRFITSVLARAFHDRHDLASAVRLASGLVFVAMVLWALTLRYARWQGFFLADVHPDSFTLYYRLSAVVCVVPPLAWALSYAAPAAALALLVSLFVLALLPLEAHPGAGPAALATPSADPSAQPAQPARPAPPR